jgi:hypothetical protein
MYPEDPSNCGCSQEPTTNPVTPPAPPACTEGEPCAEIINTSCVRYDGPALPGMAAVGDDLTEILQSISAGGGGTGGGGGGGYFVLKPADDGTISINGSSAPVTVYQPGQEIIISASGAVGPQGETGPPGQSVNPEGFVPVYNDMIAEYGGTCAAGNGVTPALNTAIMLIDEVSGVNGKIYIYNPTSSSADECGWVDIGQLAGPPGTNGTPGPQGPAGKSILYGGSDPIAANGNNGDFYLNTTTYKLFGPKVGGAWPIDGVSLIGSTGSPGPPGTAGSAGTAATITVGSVIAGLPDTDPLITEAAGSTAQNRIYNFQIPQGNDGTDGSKILSGTSAATGGVAGDYYLNTATGVLFGPKTTAGWPNTGLLLKGANGANGADGAEGPPGPPGPPGQNGTSGATGVNAVRTVNSADWTLLANGTVVGGATTSTSTDQGVFIVMNDDNTARKVVVPWNLDTTNFPINFQVSIFQKGNSQVRIEAGTSGTNTVSILSANNMKHLRTQYSACTLLRVGQNEWFLFGDLTNVVI